MSACCRNDSHQRRVKTNPRFVEALMLGAPIGEMGREMLWQGYLTDSRGTPFQKFWQRTDDRDDIAPIHQWSAVRLGKRSRPARRCWCC